jgi:hypothetical protein
MYKQTFSQSRKILKEEEFMISQKLDIIPNYDLTIDIQIASTPFIPGLSEITPQTTYINETAHIWIFNIITIGTLIGILIILLILILLIRAVTKKKKLSQT